MNKCLICKGPHEMHGDCELVEVESKEALEDYLCELIDFEEQIASVYRLGQSLEITQKVVEVRVVED